MRLSWRTRRAEVLSFRPPADAPVSRIGGHLRRRLARVPGTRRRARPYHDGRRYTRRRTTGKNGRHALVGMLRQSVFGRLAGYEDVNDPERLRHDPAMRWIVGGKAALGAAASPEFCSPISCG
jgi:Transposase DDE domain group 1